jgi:hypothetical protein
VTSRNLTSVFFTGFSSKSIDDPVCFTELFGSLDGFERWDDALDAGLAALKNLTFDRAIGPRLQGEGEDGNADPVGRRMRRSLGFGDLPP